jgi:integrase
LVKQAAIRQTVTQFLVEWMGVHQLSVRARTADNYRQHIRSYILPIIGDTYLNELTAGQVVAVATMQQHKGLSAGTIRLTQIILRQAFDDAVEWGLMIENVAKRVALPHVPDTVIKPTTATDAQQLLEAVEGTKYEPLYILMLSLGLRRGEVCALRWGDVDFSAGTLSISRSVQRVTGKGLVVSEPKTSASRRVLPLPRLAASVLGQLFDATIESRKAAPKSIDYIFPGKGKAPVDPQAVYMGLQSALNKAGIDPMGLHQLRHAFGTLLRSKGVSEKTLMELLGHTSIRMTVRYGAVVDELKTQAASHMNAALGG